MNLIEKYGLPHYMLEENDISSRIRPRKRDSHKGTFGHGLLIAGKRGMAGAAILASRAAMRSGIGKLSIHTPSANTQILQTCIPEAILDIEESEFFSETIETDSYDAIGIGCGIGLEYNTQLTYIEQIESSNCPLVIDADGLNILGLHPEWISRVPDFSILTPHKKELRGLIGTTFDDADELAKTLLYASTHKMIIVMKGNNSRIITPDGAIYVNPTGNPGMATAGSGDVLTGIILALLAQGYPAEDAAFMGVYIHGLAGDIAKESKGEISLMASDIIDSLPQAYITLTNNNL